MASSPSGGLCTKATKSWPTACRPPLQRLSPYSSKPASTASWRSKNTSLSSAACSPPPAGADPTHGNSTPKRLPRSIGSLTCYKSSSPRPEKQQASDKTDNHEIHETDERKT